MSLRVATALVIILFQLTAIAECQSSDWVGCDEDYTSRYLMTSRLEKKLGLYMKKKSSKWFKDGYSTGFTDHRNDTISAFGEGLTRASNSDSVNRFSRSRHRRSRANSNAERYSNPQRFYEDPNLSGTVYYTFFDTFRRVNHHRRAIGHDTIKKLYRAAWSEDNCRSLRRIVGGYRVTSPEEMPFVVFVDSGCGGSIISDTWVLTAAHCVDGEQPKYVYAGSLKLLSGCRHKVVETFVHGKFNRSTLKNDIALIKVEQPFLFSEAIKPIPLASKKVRPKSCGMATGWGTDKYGGEPTKELMMAMIPVVSLDRCTIYGGLRGQFCAGYTNGDVDTCQGDSGGPFVVNGVQVGVVSYGYECASPDMPGVYVDVSFYRHWIKRIVQENTIE